MSDNQSVAVIGLGMIGGSVARGLAGRGIDVIGYDQDRSAVEGAIAEGVISRALSPGLEDIKGANVVVIAIYGDTAVDTLKALEPYAKTFDLVTDVGSTKRTIVSAAENSKLASCFVGAHPFAGDHRSGWNASRFDLFESETVYLCPSEKSDSTSIGLAQWLWASLGAHTVKIGPGEHDELLAWTSHLPHMVSTALALALSEAGIARRQLGRGGRDMARLSAGSPDVWTAIAIDNAAAITAALKGIEHQIDGFRALLENGDRDRIRERLTKARSWTGPGEH